ncbi:MAG: proteasome subunit beta [Nitrosarchaeum sp.]|nr:proteasome subunit beta [Nitrosarchaeum sp.]
MDNTRKTGTTTIGIVAKDAIILAADRRATVGHMIADDRARKVTQIAPRMGVTWAGQVADIQILTKYLKSEIQLHTLRTNREMTVREAGNLLSTWVYSVVRRMFPGITQFLIGGYDKQQRLYEVFPDGTLTEIPTFIATGSGSVFAYGVLETQYKEKMDTQEAINLAVKAVETALRRDSASGNGIIVAVIDKEGYREVMDKHITAHLT